MAEFTTSAQTKELAPRAFTVVPSTTLLILVDGGYVIMCVRKNQVCSIISMHLDLLYPAYSTVVESNFHYHAIACGDTTITNTGHITTPDYPESYPAELDCTYIIRFSSNETISLTFVTFDLNTDLFGNW